MTNPTQTHPTNGAPVPTTLAFTEAPASLTLKIAYKGYSDILFTLRDTSGAALLDKLDAAFVKFEKMGITPSAGRSTGPVASGDTPICPEHNTPMKQGKRGWFCPKSVGEHPQTGKKIYCSHTAA